MVREFCVVETGCLPCVTFTAKLSKNTTLDHFGGSFSNPSTMCFFNIFSDDENVVYTVGCVVVGGCGHFLGHLW